MRLQSIMASSAGSYHGAPGTETHPRHEVSAAICLVLVPCWSLRSAWPQEGDSGVSSQASGTPELPGGRTAEEGSSVVLLCIRAWGEFNWAGLAFSSQMCFFSALPLCELQLELLLCDFNEMWKEKGTLAAEGAGCELGRAGKHEGCEYVWDSNWLPHVIKVPTVPGTSPNCCNQLTSWSLLDPHCPMQFISRVRRGIACESFLQMGVSGAHGQRRSHWCCPSIASWSPSGHILALSLGVVSVTEACAAVGCASLVPGQAGVAVRSGCVRKHPEQRWALVLRVIAFPELNGFITAAFMCLLRRWLPGCAGALWAH